ncbi:MAG: S49 family peptidase, partial [Hydrogenophaga sp.]|nr:S49 family peptidase [Hydrogenophaga sp.]
MNDDNTGLPQVSDRGKNVPWERATIEKLVFAQLKEQQAARRWKLFGRLIWLLVFGAIAWMLFNGNHMSSAVSTPHTAVIDIKGEIASDTEASADNVIASLHAAFEDSGAQAVV